MLSPILPGFQLDIAIVARQYLLSQMVPVLQDFLIDDFVVVNPNHA